MNQEDLMRAIGAVKEEMLDESERCCDKKVERRIIGIPAIAACVLAVVLVIGQMITYLPGYRVFPERFSWKLDHDVEIKNNLDSSSVVWYKGLDYRFTNEMVVEARVLDVLPDAYSSLDMCIGGRRYRVLRMETRDVVSGTGMPSAFYYCLPAELSTNLKQYSSLIMTVDQIGLENYLMINLTENRPETFDMVFWAGDAFDPHWGAVLAFKNGILDEGLWDLKGWDAAKSTMEHRIHGNTSYPASAGMTLDAVKQAISEQISYVAVEGPFCMDERVASLCDFSTDKVNETLGYLQPFANGVFTQRYEKNCVTYNRIIDGFLTNEYIIINGSDQSPEVIRSGERFTEADIRNAPDMGSVLEKLANMKPPEQDAKTNDLVFAGADGIYIKTGNEIVGKIVVYWGSPERRSEKRGAADLVVSGIKAYSYFYVAPDGNYREITAEESGKLG